MTEAPVTMRIVNRKGCLQFVPEGNGHKTFVVSEDACGALLQLAKDQCSVCKVCPGATNIDRFGYLDCSNWTEMLIRSKRCSLPGLGFNLDPSSIILSERRLY